MRFIGNVNLALNHILRAGFTFEIESLCDSISNDPALVREVLAELHGDLARLYAGEGRPSIPPEQLLGALLLQAFYGVRSERQLMEQLDYNLLFRWFVGLSPDEAVWVAATFTKNRERLQAGDVFGKFMTRLLGHPREAAALGRAFLGHAGSMPLA